jgi:phosphatidylserine decarboxylase
MNYIKKIVLLLFLCSFHLQTKPAGNPGYLIRFLYQNQFGKTLRSLITSNPYASILAGAWADHWSSRYVIKKFATSYAIDMTQAERTNFADYYSLNDFFTRKLRADARPIDQGRASVISPADGQLVIRNKLQKGDTLAIKHKELDLAQILACPQMAEQFYGGTAVIIYLAPHDYHRFHFPFTCIPHHPEKIAGGYESVHPLVSALGINPLSHNERHIIWCQGISSASFIVIAVGALCVGRITETFHPFKKYSKGDEVGYFSFGGSTVILLFKPGTFTPEFPMADKSRPITIRMGQRIGALLESGSNV